MLKGLGLFSRKPAEEEIKEIDESISLLAPRVPEPYLELGEAKAENARSEPAWEVVKSLSTIVFAKENQSRIMCTTLLTCVGTMLNFVAPYLLGVTLESLREEKESLTPEVLALMLITAYTLGQLIPNYREEVMAPVTANNNKVMITKIVDHQLNRSLQYHFETPFSDQLYLVNKGFSVMSNASTVFTTIIPTMLEITMAVTVLSTRYGPGMGAGIATMAGAFTAYSAMTTKPVVDSEDRMREAGNKNWGKIQRALKQYKIIHDFNKYPSEIKLIKEAIIDSASAEINKLVTPLRVGRGHIMIPRLGMLAAALYVANGIQKRELNEQDFILLLTYLNQLSIMLPNVGKALNSLFGGYPDLKFVFNELAINPEIISEKPGVELELKRAPSIKFENISFSYPLRENKEETGPVLKDLSFEIKQGETVALISESGGGKSSIFKLLYKYYKPSSGRILIDGHDISTINRQSLQSQIALIGQDPSLTHGSVRENIVFAAKDSNAVTDEGLMALAKQGNLDGFIANLKGGLDKQVGDNGNQLSGGQQQRVAVLRGLMKRAPIRMLDEITSALDGVVAKHVLEGVMQNTAGETRLMITHKLSEARVADRIIVLDKGRVLDTGTHDALLQGCDLYQEMWKAQNITNPARPSI